MDPAFLPAPRRSRLRASSGHAHARVDAVFRDGLRDAADYRAYLRGMHALVRSLDAVLQRPGMASRWSQWRHPQRLQWLHADLVAVQAAPLPPGPALALDCGAALAGALYVVEGSMLGARQLLRDAAPRAWTAEAGACFLHGHADDGHRWRRFLDCLEAADFDAAAERALLDAAGLTFAAAEHEFRRARAFEDLHGR